MSDFLIDRNNWLIAYTENETAVQIPEQVTRICPYAFRQLPNEKNKVFMASKQ